MSHDRYFNQRRVIMHVATHCTFAFASTRYNVDDVFIDDDNVCIVINVDDVEYMIEFDHSFTSINASIDDDEYCDIIVRYNDASMNLHHVIDCHMNMHTQSQLIE